MSEESQDKDAEAPFPTGAKDEHSKFVDPDKVPVSTEEPTTESGLGEGATAGADDPETGSGEQAGSEKAEIARPPRGAS